jgi:hypothetical protein
MSSWRDHILKEFTPKIAQLTIVADPDELLLEEQILASIRHQSYEVIPFEDHIAFRYDYESRFRSRWDKHQDTELFPVLRFSGHDFTSLPYDLIKVSRRLSFNLGDIFPKLSYPILAALDRSDWDALYNARAQELTRQLGENATKDFVLRHVFEIAPDLIERPLDLLRVLLRRHYTGRLIPRILDERLIQVLRQRKIFDDWPLESLVWDRETFFKFLQERWPIFLDTIVANSEADVLDHPKSYALSVDGPATLPFDHHDMRIYVNNLFLEGLLSSVPHEATDLLSRTWVNIGVKPDSSEEKSRRLAAFVDTVQSSIPAEDARHGEWFHFARAWAKLIFLMSEANGNTSSTNALRIEALRSQVDKAFASWLSRRYAGLINLPPVPPVMLHHVARYLHHQLFATGNSVALLLIDGLSLDQWLIVRDALTSHQSNLNFHDSTVFAWIPSITSISRQAAFAGKPPIFFPNSLYSTAREPALWMQFWADHGLSADEVVYAKGLGEGDLNHLEELLSHPKARVAGLVIDKIDKIMHGMELGTLGMHNQVRQWAQMPYLATLLDILLNRGFRVYLTSDHGNVEAKGYGRPGEGAVADLRAQRVRIYPDSILRSKVSERFPEAVVWPPIGLPETCLALIAPARLAFIREGKRKVSHGGNSVEEIIVPFIEIGRIEA